jgi:hypothetical protein
MEVYPITPVPSYAYVFADEFQTLPSEFEGSNEQRQMLRRFGKRSFQLAYNKIFETEWVIIHNFFKKMKGGYEPFWFFDLKIRHWIDEYIARGNGSIRVFDLHSKLTNPEGLVVYVNGSPVTFSFLPGGGQANADRVLLDVAPASGTLITSDFYGYLRIKAKIPDKFSDTLSTVIYTDLEAISIKEIHW